MSVVSFTPGNVCSWEDEHPASIGQELAWETEAFRNP
jgi:hypothetical protein